MNSSHNVGGKRMIKKEVEKAINHMYTFISIDRDTENKVTIEEVYEMLDELKKVLKIE